MITPLVTLPVAVNQGTTIARATDTVTLNWSLKTSAGDNTQTLIPANHMPSIDPTIINTNLTYRQLIKDIGMDPILTPVQQLTIISEYKYNGMSKEDAISAMNNLVKPETPIDDEKFDALVTGAWGTFGKDGYTLTPASFDRQLDQQISYETEADGSISVKPLIITFTKIPTNLSGDFFVNIIKPNIALPISNRGYTMTDTVLETATIRTAYNQAYPNINPIERVRTITNYLNGTLSAEQSVANYNQATGTTLTTADFLQLPEIAQDTYNLKGYEIDEAALAQTLATDISQTPVTQAKIADITLNIPLKKIAEKPEVTIPPVTGETGLPDYTGAVPGKTAKYIYGIKALNLYRSPNLTAANKVAGYAKQRRVNRPVFKVIGYEYSNAGRLRYRVKDVNVGRKTYGKTGYITARTSFTKPLYYTRLPKNRTITVINKTGIYGYRAKSLTGKRVHYKKGTHLKVKKVLKHNLTTRYQLTNGRYITTNNKFIIAGRY